MVSESAVSACGEQAPTPTRPLLVPELQFSNTQPVCPNTSTSRQDDDPRDHSDCELVECSISSATKEAEEARQRGRR